MSFSILETAQIVEQERVKIDMRNRDPPVKGPCIGAIERNRVLHLP